MGKTLTQTFESPERWYRLEYPRIWEMEIVDQIPAFFDPFEGKGALQVFCANLAGDQNKKVLKEFPFLGGNSLVDKMRIFLHMQGADPKDEELKVYPKSGISFVPYEYYNEGRFYMCVLMEKDEILLLALYNSEGSPEAEEARIIGEIIQSIEIPA